MRGTKLPQPILAGDSKMPNQKKPSPKWSAPSPLTAEQIKRYTGQSSSLTRTTTTGAAGGDAVSERTIQNLAPTPELRKQILAELESPDPADGANQATPDQTNAAQEPTPEQAYRKQAKMCSMADFKRLANSDSREDLKLLDDLLENNPWFWQVLGDLREDALGAIAFTAVGEDSLTSVCVLRAYEGRTKELAGENPTALEELAAGQIVMARQALNALTCRLASDLNPKSQPRNQQALIKAEQRVQAAYKSMKIAKEISAMEAAKGQRFQVYHPPEKEAKLG